MATTDEQEERILSKAEPVMEPTDVFSMYELQRLMIQKRIRLPDIRQAEEIHKQLGAIVAYTDTNEQSSKIKFSPKNPHFVSGAQVFATALHDLSLRAERPAPEPAYDVGNWRQGLAIRPLGRVNILGL